MDLRQLRYFVAVAETGNISRAAKRIFLTQPALSRQIKALEEETGLFLLDRQAHSVRLTAAGEAFLPEARELLQHADQVLQRVRDAGQGVRLRVGYAPSLASGMLSAAVVNFTQAHPGARVELFDLSTSEMFAGLENRTLDVVLTVRRDGGARGLKWIPLVSTAWKLAVNSRHPLSERPRVTPVDVAGEPLLVFCQRDYPEYWDIINGWLREHGARPVIGGEYDGVESLMAAVESGLGVAVVSSRTANLFPSRGRLKTLSPAPPPLRIVAGYRLGTANDRPLEVFVAELHKAAQSFA